MTGAELRVQRELLGFSRAQLADILGITGGVIADWEDGRDPTPYHLPARVGEIAAFTDQYLQRLRSQFADKTSIVTYRTDAAYQELHPDPVYTASWHRRVCGRLLQGHPELTVEFHELRQVGA
ncbi:hypothetical protein FIV07_27820 (plasmid) [Mycobacterium sp. THAF192]|nr:hypothetical protein FIV07_27820 [Mycobacterium sp. THAF192]